MYMYDEYIHGSTTTKGIPWIIKHPLGKTILWLKVANTLHRQNDQRQNPKATTRLYGRTYFCSDEVDGLFVSMLTSLLQELPLCAPASLAYIQWDLGRRSEWKLGLFHPCRRVRKKVSSFPVGARRAVQQRNRPKGTIWCRCLSWDRCPWLPALRAGQLLPQQCWV